MIAFSTQFTQSTQATLFSFIANFSFAALFAPF